MAKTLICPKCNKAAFDPEHVYEKSLQIKCDKCGAWSANTEWKTVAQLQGEVQELISLERQYSQRLGEMARLSDIVCTWALEHGNLEEESPEVKAAAEEIMEYVEAVRP